MRNVGQTNGFGAMVDEPDWLKYQREVHSQLVELYPESHIRHDVRLPGNLSNAQRQVDVLVEERLAGQRLVTAVDAKHHGRPIDVKEVESFLGLLRDVGVDRGLMVSAKGYTAAAMTRAWSDDVDLDLDVLSLAELKQWQGEAAIPYAGRNGIVLSAPLGWIIDGQRRPGTLARLYRRGLSFEGAVGNCEFMYVNIWDRRAPVDSLEALLDEQARQLREVSPDVTISVRELGGDIGWRGCIRRADVPSYPTAELTGLVEFPDAILIVVLFTPLVGERRNVRKLEYVLRKALPMSVRHAAQQAAAPDGQSATEGRG